MSGSLSRFFGVLRLIGVGAFGGARSGLLCRMGAGDGAFAAFLARLLAVDRAAECQFLVVDLAEDRALPDLAQRRVS